MQGHGQNTAEFSAPSPAVSPRWLERARKQLPGPGHYLVCADRGEKIRVFAVKNGWTRIGRSVTADIRLDDPSVSRRHALIVNETGRKARVLDDRSLNGIVLNGELVEWGRLSDGDELMIGRYRLYALER
jgi:pSer/pThr/pTyr-binding forkhead associated (FHA) protein